MSVLSKKYFHNEKAAIKKLESVLWNGTPVCPHCGGQGRSYEIKSKKARAGLRKCGHCRKQYTVKVGTVFESSHVPLHKWFQAVYLMCSSKKGISSHQLHRTLEVTYKTAWFMTHRIREAMKDSTLLPLGDEGKAIEAAETFIGRKYDKSPNSRGHDHKHVVPTLIERGGRARSVHLEKLTAKNIREHAVQNIDHKSDLMTDRAFHYVKVGKEFASHERVDHGHYEYVRGDAHTNTCEGFFSILKRGMKGVYQHCGEKHLQRYLAEFDFRYNERSVTDAERTVNALRGIVGKRLTYQTTC